MIDYDERRRQKNLAKIRAQNRKKAESKGGQNEARSLLNSASAAISSVLTSGNIGEGDAVALEFLRDGLREFLDSGVSIDVALCINKERGAPKKNDLLPLVAYVPWVDAEYRKSGNVASSITAVAVRFGVSAITIRRAWNEAGGIDGHISRKIN